MNPIIKQLQLQTQVKAIQTVIKQGSSTSKLIGWVSKTTKGSHRMSSAL